MTVAAIAVAATTVALGALPLSAQAAETGSIPAVSATSGPLAGSVATSGATGSKLGFTSVAKTSAGTGTVLALLTAPVPKITGTAAVGWTLTVVPGTWTSGVTLTRQWYADGVAITGATAATFLPTTAQDGKAITVKVTGKKAGYATVTKTSAATLRVTRSSVPTISGSFGVGSTLTAKPGTWTTGATFTHQWYAMGIAITGATASTFKLTTAQKDRQISVKVTGSKSGHTKVAKTSSLSLRVATSVTPTITGVFMYGATLTAKPNTWTIGTAFTYQWYAAGVAITGATKSTLVLGTAQRDKQISVTVTGRKSGYGTVARGSATSLRVALAGVPSISGTRMVGSTLSARTGTWTPGTAYGYQWYVNGVAVSGATGSTYKLSKTHIGKAISVRVGGSLAGYQTITRTSATTSAVESGKAWPISRDNCPSSHPIKGNQTTQYTTDWIFHVPGGQYYAVTDPEECFANEAAAVAWGYRKSMR